jgi:O-antigen/teichoic acid export membrane protein
MTAHTLGRDLGGSAFLGQAAAVFGANLLQAAIPFASLLIVGRRFGLDAAGEYAFAQALTLPAFQFLSLQLKPLLLTRSSQDLPLGSALHLRALSSVVAILFAGAAYIGFGAMALLLAAGRLLESWSELSHADWQRQGKAHRALAASAARAAAALLALLSAASPETGLALYLAANLTLLLVFETPRGRQSYAAGIRELLHSGALLGLVMLLLSLQAQIPRFALERFSSSASLGVFATLTAILQAGNLVASSYGQSLLPKLPSATSRQIAAWVCLPSLLAAVVALPVVIARVGLVEILVPGAGVEAANTLAALAALQLVAWPAATIGCALTAKRLHRPQLWIAGASNLAAALGAWTLVPLWGAVGAAAAMAITSISTLALSFIALQLGERP